MPSLPLAGEITRYDLAVIRVQRLYDGPRAPQNPIARLITSSALDSSTEPPDSVRAAQSNAIIRRLLRYRSLVAVACPKMLSTIDNRIRYAQSLAR